MSESEPVEVKTKTMDNRLLAVIEKMGHYIIM